MLKRIVAKKFCTHFCITRCTLHLGWSVCTPWENPITLAGSGRHHRDVQKWVKIREFNFITVNFSFIGIWIQCVTFMKSILEAQFNSLVVQFICMRKRLDLLIVLALLNYPYYCAISCQFFNPKLACFTLNWHFVVFNGRKESRDFALVIITPFLLA